LLLTLRFKRLELKESQSQKGEGRGRCALGKASLLPTARAWLH
jgi:hypothetical protein